MKVYEAIADALVAEGVKDYFGLMGDGNMWLWNALSKKDGVNIVSARHEAAGVSMADGYSRTTGKVGVSMVTCGPGLTQCGTVLMIAARNRSQMVLIAGEINPGSKNNTQSMDQRRFAEACSARFHTVTSIDNMAEEIAEAFYTTRVHRVPVVLNLNMDLQDRTIDWDFEYKPSTMFLPPRVETPNPEALAAVVEKLAAAERPVIIAGRGARLSGAKDELLKLGERTGALLATSLVGKGLFTGEAWDVGISGAFASEPTETLLAEADFVLGVGAELGYHTTEGGLIFPSAEVARIDIKAQPEEIGIIPGLYVQGDAKKTIIAINEALEKRGVKKAGFRTAASRAVLDGPAHQFPKPNDGLDPREVALHLARAIPKGALITCGAGHFFSWPAMYMAMPEGAEIQFSYQFGAVGQGLPLAIGTGTGNPGRPHIAIEGDGSMLFHIQELDTVVRFGLQMVLIVWNDGGYAAEFYKLDSKDMIRGQSKWDSPDFAAIARAFGGEGVTLQNEADLPAAIEAGLAKGGLYLIDVRVSNTTPSDPFNKVHFGLPNRAPLLRPVA